MYDADGEGHGDDAVHDGVSILVVAPIIAVIVAGILFAIFNAAMGGEASFKQVSRSWCTPASISALSQLFSGADQLFPRRGDAASPTSARCCRCCGERRSSANLLGMIDLFLIWYIVVLAIGLAVLYRRRTQPIAISLLGVYAVIAIVVALFKSRAGGA